jgi:hypothetical protein
MTSSSSTRAGGLPISNDLGAALAGCSVSRPWATGLCAALSSGPARHVPPSVRVGTVLAERKIDDGPVLAAGRDALLRVYDLVQHRLRESALAAHSLVPAPDDVDAIAEFCLGYLRGAAMHDAWLRDRDAALMLVMIAALAGELPIDELRGPDDRPLADPEGWLRTQREMLGEQVAGMYDYWRARAQEDVPAARETARVGRNDPCPCGSGKKYKKCCLQ